MIKNLSPSRASQFKTCPKQFKFSNVDKLKEPTNEVQAKGTTVHQALEDLFDLPKEERNVEIYKYISIFYGEKHNANKKKLKRNMILCMFHLLEIQ